MTNADPHFILVPLMAQGHMIPMVDIAHLLAHRGATVTFITTPVNAARIQPIIDRAAQSNLPIHFTPLPFPATQVGLPEGCENVDLIPPGYPFKLFFDATRLLEEPLHLYIRNHTHPGPTIIIHDYCHPWIMNISSKMKIPRLVFTGTSAFYLLCIRNIRLHGLYDGDAHVPFMIPDLPNRVEITLAHAPAFFNAPGWEDIRDEAIEAEGAAEGMLINTFDELESGFIQRMGYSTGKKVWAIGPLSLFDDANKATRGNKAAVDEEMMTSWLGSMEPKSVVYVSFGTLSRMGPVQIMEIGFGLEAADQPFVWVIKEKSPEVEKWLSEGFKERTKGRGLIVQGWAPQVMILSHPAVGGFLTHCGWNSTLEAVSAGVPMITWPHYTDQFLNEKLIVEVLGIGVAMRREEGVVVERSEVEKAVVRLMDEGEEGEKRRVRASELGVEAKNAMKENGSSHKNLTSIIKFFSEHSSNDAVVSE